MYSTYNDKNTYAKKDFSIHAIQDMPYSNCFSLGMYAVVNSYNPPAAGVAKRYCSQPNMVKKVFAAPKSFEKGWDTTGAGHWCRCKARP